MEGGREGERDRQTETETEIETETDRRREGGRLHDVFIDDHCPYLHGAPNNSILLCVIHSFAADAVSLC